MELSVPDMPFGVAGNARVQPRTQASLAVTADGENWALINASPDLPLQIRQSRALHPRNGTRESPIKAVLLTGAEIDQVAGLLSLRGREFLLCATAVTLAALAENAMFGVLAPDVGTRKGCRSAPALMLPGGLQAQLFTVPGKVPPLSRKRQPGNRQRDGSKCRHRALRRERAHRLYPRRRGGDAGDAGTESKALISARLCAHQQHQSDPDRRLARAPARGRQGLGNRRRRNGDHVVRAMTLSELEAQLRDIGARRYHRLHPFHALRHGGKCSKGQVQAWALNRYYYQATIPLKD
jgi:Beta-lactamase superfamily domain/TENA/THI-4/PQQC family